MAKNRSIRRECVGSYKICHEAAYHCRRHFVHHPDKLRVTVESELAQFLPVELQRARRNLPSLLPEVRFYRLIDWYGCGNR